MDQDIAPGPQIIRGLYSLTTRDFQRKLDRLNAWTLPSLQCKLETMATTCQMYFQVPFDKSPLSLKVGYGRSSNASKMCAYITETLRVYQKAVSKQ